MKCSICMRSIDEDSSTVVLKGSTPIKIHLCEDCYNYLKHQLQFLIRIRRNSINDGMKLGSGGNRHEVKQAKFNDSIFK